MPRTRTRTRRGVRKSRGGTKRSTLRKNRLTLRKNRSGGKTCFKYGDCDHPYSVNLFCEAGDTDKCTYKKLRKYRDEYHDGDDYY